MDEPTYDGNAYTVTSTYHDGTLKLYTSHPVVPSSVGHEPEYAMTQLNSWSMTGNSSAFYDGATAYRNARDWMKEIRDCLIEAANKRALESQQNSSSPTTDPSTSTTVLVDSDTSTESEAEFHDAEWSSKDPIVDEDGIQPLKRASKKLGTTTTMN
ncbi:conserved hypothetical protein [Histoplasma capsulatum var. duboisii H88]|uniref:Uncharacterized protein n=2 Tax=Ajellomyces capsulatus TaxID=5037 RepID=F0UEW7_AJEC8|nr:conserved hypothetical protein [Histoplasma capsulatum H143]EGC44032.1 conserved hypothetical protein [Histoplasma capsulatum var. duboisii H88]QSS54826.1 hypothetical protein I7I53_02508 [Histoplasma capsulatum var. duboisii H88]